MRDDQLEGELYQEPLGECDWEGCERDAFERFDLGVDTSTTVIVCGPHAEKVRDGEHQLDR